jgi:hypothetical protein
MHTSRNAAAPANLHSWRLCVPPGRPGGAFCPAAHASRQQRRLAPHHPQPPSIPPSVVGPFGGIKQSGICRKGSRLGLEDYEDLKHLCIGGLYFDIL